MEALMLVKPYKRLLMYSIDSEERKQSFVKDMSARLGIEVKSMPSGGALVAECGIVVTTTPARKGYFEAEWVHPGLHITSMGSDAEDKQELKGAVFSKADLIVCDLKAQSFRLGELRGAKEVGYVNEKTPVKEIGQIIRDGKSARTDSRQVTICDLTGVGVQDTMIALMAYEIARRERAGIVVPR
jgi:ornithine cyclodeaminase